MVENDLSSAALTGNLRTRFIGQRFIYYPALPSTMEVARREAKQGAPEGTVIFAGEQTAGKGRLSRTWLTPKGSLAFSIILYPAKAHLPYIVMLSSLAVVHCIEEVAGLKAQIKWPNDVLFNGKKVCGILIENSLRGSTVDYAIIGIGLNVNLRLADFPEITPIATSLSHELGREVSLPDILQRLLAEIERLYLTLPAESIYEEWRDRLITLGKRVRATSGEAVSEGIAESVNSDGGLLLRQPDGNLISIAAGDVTLRD